MNKVILQGTIKNIQPSHISNDIEYYKANLIVKRNDNKEDILNLKFKRFSNPYKENDEIILEGNIRTFSQKNEDGHNSVEVYVFTYFDIPEIEETLNLVLLNGKICKKGELHKTLAGKDVIDFIVANNITTDNQSFNCYIPLVAWGKWAKQVDKMPIGSDLSIKGQFHSREYRKKLSEEDFEIRVAHEIDITEIIEDCDEI